MDVVATLLSSAAGGAIALYAAYLNNKWTSQRFTQQFSHERSTKKSELLRERGEELYVLCDKWLIALADNYLGLSFVMQGKLTYNQHYDSMKNSIYKEYNFGRIEMLVDVYFPQIRAAYDAVINARTELNKVAATHKKSYVEGDADGEVFLPAFVQAQKQIEKAGYDFKRQIIREIHNI